MEAAAEGGIQKTVLPSSPREYLFASLFVALSTLSVDVRVRKSLSGVQQRRLNNSTHVAHIFCCRPPPSLFPLPRSSSPTTEGKSAGRERVIFFAIFSKGEMPPFCSPESDSASVPPPVAVFSGCTNLASGI